MGRVVRVSVIISTRDRPGELARCLESVRRAIGPEDEIVVVDSASRDAETLRAIAEASRARVLRCDVAGSARARNVGAQNACGHLLAFVDDDAIVEPGWLQALVEGFADPAVGAVVGPVFELGSDPPRLLKRPRGFSPDRDRAQFTRNDRDWFRRANFGGIGFGTNLAVRRTSFEEQGGFREGLGAGAAVCGDESYYLLTLIERGGCVLNQPSARVHHPRQSTERLRELRNSRVAYLLYVMMTRPELRWQAVRTVMLRRAEELGRWRRGAR